MFKRPISSLNLPECKIKELHNKGYIFCEDVDPKIIFLEVGITEEKWKELIKLTPTKTALDILQEEYFSCNILTFCKDLDEIFGGGVPLKLITEFCGKPGSGKTQICLQLCVSAQLPKCFGGIFGHAVYIDTSCNFSKERFLEIIHGRIRHCTLLARKHNSLEMITSLTYCTEQNFMNNLHYLRATKFLELISSMHYVKELLNKNNDVRLIVIDSITKPIKQCNLENYDRIKILYSYLSDLQELAQKHNFAIVVTNDFTTKVDVHDDSYVAPSLGDSYSHRINNRVILNRISDTEFSATLNKSVIMPSTTVNFRIGKGGLRDYN